MIMAISAYIKTIASFLVFSAFVEIIVPESKFKKYISMVMGLLMIGVIISPLLGLELNKSEYIFDKYFDNDEMSNKNPDYEKKHQELIDEIYKSINEEGEG